MELIRSTPKPSGSGAGSRIRVATIAAGTVAAVVVLFGIGLIVYLRLRRKREKAETVNVAEIGSHYKFELSEDGKTICEAPGSECRHEFPDNWVPVEADRGNCVTHAVELPTTNFHEEGRWGVPIIRVPSPTHLGRTGWDKEDESRAGQAPTPVGNRPEGPES